MTGDVRLRLRTLRLRLIAGPLWWLAETAPRGIRNSVAVAHRRTVARRRSFGPADLDLLDRLLRRADAVMPVGEASALRREDRPPRLIALRHDMDHDVDNAVRFAHWEADHGYRSTYYVLHGDWYWSRTGTGRPSRLVLDALAEIASLGHEVGLHNNSITLALRHGGDPARILHRDLDRLRAAGHAVTGTVSHGDDLCHELGYLNSEVFSDFPSPGFGMPDRSLAWPGRPGGPVPIRLAPRPMAAFGLTHEANWVGHDLYLSDTGGRWKPPFDEVAERFAAAPAFLQVLVHPVWWALSGESYIPRASTPTPEGGEGEAGEGEAGEVTRPV